jgi:hypothetical protein
MVMADAVQQVERRPSSAAETPREDARRSTKAKLHGGSMPKEPQSYGSQGDWVTGHVDQEVNRQDARAGENRRESEESGPHQGGHVAEVQEQSAAPETCDTFDGPSDDVKKVTAEKGGARRDGFFKERDYKG